MGWARNSGQLYPEHGSMCRQGREWLFPEWSGAHYDTCCNVNILNDSNERGSCQNRAGLTDTDFSIVPPWRTERRDCSSITVRPKRQESDWPLTMRRHNKHRIMCHAKQINALIGGLIRVINTRRSARHKSIRDLSSLKFLWPHAGQGLMANRLSASIGGGWWVRLSFKWTVIETGDYIASHPITLSVCLLIASHAPVYRTFISTRGWDRK